MKIFTNYYRKYNYRSQDNRHECIHGIKFLNSEVMIIHRHLRR